MRKAILSVVIALLAANSLRAQGIEKSAPHIENARLETRALSGQLAPEVNRWAGQSSGPQWLGYAVPQIPGDRRVCCNDSGSWGDQCGTCQLERGHNDVNITSNNAGTVKLEGPRNLVVLFRGENKQITTIRVAAEECTLDAGGLPFV